MNEKERGDNDYGGLPDGKTYSKILTEVSHPLPQIKVAASGSEHFSPTQVIGMRWKLRSQTRTGTKTQSAKSTVSRKSRRLVPYKQRKMRKMYERRRRVVKQWEARLGKLVSGVRFAKVTADKKGAHAGVEEKRLWTGVVPSLALRKKRTGNRPGNDGKA